MEKIQYHGFIQPEILPEDYIFGSSPIEGEILQPNGQWDACLPTNELQLRNGLESVNCTSYATLNCLEILFNRKFNQNENFSERYIGILAETTPAGNTPQKVIETIRKTAGLIPESLLPFNDDINTWEEYYSPNPMTSDLLYVGKNFLDRYEIKHDWVITNYNTDKQAMKDALKFSPLGSSVFAWIEKDGFYIKDKPRMDNHFCTVFGYEEGKYWKVFDHYNDTIKKLDWNYQFGFVKRYHIGFKKTDLASLLTQKSVSERIFFCFKRYFSNILKVGVN